MEDTVNRLLQTLAWIAAVAAALPAAALAYSPNAADLSVPPGYKVELYVKGLNTPMGITWDEKGEAYVLESGWQKASDNEATAIQVFDKAGKHLRTLAKGKLDPGASLGITYHAGSLYVSGTNTIWKVNPNSGEVAVWVKDLPTFGDHNVSKVQFKGEYVYFGLGSDTNSSVVGEDVAGPTLAKTMDPNTGELAHDVPCKDIVLSGVSYTTKDDKGKEIHTSPYRPYGVAAPRGTVVKGHVPCTSSVERAKISDPQNTMEVLDWGFRNPFGLAFAPANHPVLHGALLVSNNGPDMRGSRPIANAPDELHVSYGGAAWHGWPDSFGFLLANWKQGSVEVTGTQLGDNAKGAQLVFDHLPGVIHQPIALFPIDSSADGMDFSHNKAFGEVNDLFIALWGQIGFAPVDLQESASNVLRVHFLEPAGTELTPFVWNTKPGVASLAGTGGLNHPIEARFDPSGAVLYVTDFGPVDVHAFRPSPGEGVVWKVSHK